MVFFFRSLLYIDLYVSQADVGHIGFDKVYNFQLFSCFNHRNKTSVCVYNTETGHKSTNRVTRNFSLLICCIHRTHRIAIWCVYSELQRIGFLFYFSFLSTVPKQSEVTLFKPNERKQFSVNFPIIMGTITQQIDVGDFLGPHNNCVIKAVLFNHIKYLFAQVVFLHDHFPWQDIQVQTGSV